MDDMTTSITTTAEVTPAPAPKAKRTRTPKPKSEPILEPVLTPPADRSLEDLDGVDIDEMTNGELKTILQDLYQKCTELSNLCMRKDQEIRNKDQQLSRYQSYAGYVRETIDHARNSLLLQGDALNIMSRGSVSQKG